MKKALFTILIVAIASTSVLAQVKAGIKLGADFSLIKPIGINGNELPDEAYDELKRLTSPRLGFTLDVPVNDMFFIHAGVDGAFRGSKFPAYHDKNDSIFETTDTEVILCIDIPVAFGYNYQLDGAKLFAMAGPVYTIHTYATDLFKYNGNYDNIHLTIGKEPYDTYLPSEFGARIEAGVEINRFLFSASYTHGLTNITYENNLWVTKTNVIGFSATVKFGEVDNGRRRGGHRRR